MEKQGNKGYITVEATLILTMFMMAYMCMMSLVQIVRAQSIIQYATDQAALDLSRSTYILTKTGVTDQMYGTSVKGQAFADGTSKMVKSVADFFSSVSELGSGGLSGLPGQVQNVSDSFDAAQSNVEDYFSNTDELWMGVTSWGKMKVQGEVENMMVSAMVKSRIKKQIETMSSKDADTFLKDLGIKNGLAGLNCRQSKWMQVNEQGRPGIKVAVTYEVDVNWFYFDLDDLRYKVCGYTAVW